MSEQKLAECLEELARAARYHLEDSSNPSWRDRLSTITADAFALLHRAPRPLRVITVEELLSGDPVVKVGNIQAEAALARYNLPGEL